MKVMSIIAAISIASIVFLGCDKTAKNQGNELVKFSSFRDVPGVTEDEIKAVELLVEQGSSFVYGNLESTEAFY